MDNFFFLNEIWTKKSKTNSKSEQKFKNKFEIKTKKLKTNSKSEQKN
jgi:hypothetical protein